MPCYNTAMKLKEKTLKQTSKFQGIIVKVRHDDILLPDGNSSKREVVEHPGGVCIAAKNEKGEFLLVQQYRYAFQEVMLEFPAGKLELDEVPIEAAKRELIEETGYEADVILPLGEFYPSVGYLDEKIYLFYAPKTHYVGQALDPGEYLNVKTYTYEQLKDLALNETINDGKTIALLFRMHDKAV